MQRVPRYTYKELVARVSRSTGYPTEQCKAILDNAFNTILVHVTLGKSVEVKDFGIFKMKHMGRRTISQHYVSGEEAISPEHMKLSFKEAAHIKRVMAEVLQESLDALRQGNEDCE